jgi:cytochrome c biogenesis protein
VRRSVMATTKTVVDQGRAAATDVKLVESSLSRSESVIDRALRLFSSVRFGIVMLLLLLGCCVIGMFIMQQNVQGFREYYAKLTPSQRTLYGALDLFDIYHSWYFALLLAITGINIILSSIDRFPAAWQYVRRPKLLASPAFIRAQAFNVEAEIESAPDKLTERIAQTWRKHGLRARINRDQDRITVFAQRGVWNRLGAYAVHVALLMIFAGGFLTSRYGVGGVMDIAPGESSNTFKTFQTELEGDRTGRLNLPFSIRCTDLQQELIRPEGGLDAMNTIDWLSSIEIQDGEKQVPALIHLNAPFDYRGYRFFQSSFEALGSARRITVRFENAGGRPGEATIDRNGAVELEGIGHISYTAFYPDFVFERGRAETASGEYNNPVAELQITAPGGKARRAFAFNAQTSERPQAGVPSATLSGEKILLTSFEKVASSHTLTVQYDPGRAPVYAGFTLLFLSLCGVFFFSHQRVWAVIEPIGKHSIIYFGGSTNRNRPAFEARFNSLVKAAVEPG